MAELVLRQALSYWCVLYGTLLVQALWGGPLRASLGLKLALGSLCGLGLAGLLGYAFLFLWPGAGPGVHLAGEAVLLVLCGSACALRRRAPAEPTAQPSPRTTLPAPFVAVLAGLVLVACGCAVYTSMCKGLSLPIGHWDAWASWNLKARCLYLDPAGWKLYVSDNDIVPGADYPLLLPCLTARGYAYAGGVSDSTAAWMGPLFSYATLALLLCGCWRIKSLSQGLLAALAWLGTPASFQWGASQYGDTPVGAYFVGALVVLGVSDQLAGRRVGESRRGLLVLAGLLAGCGAFVKLEGQMFLLILVAVRFLSVSVARGARAAASETGAFLAGSIPGCLAVLSLRTVSDTTGYFAQNAGAGAMLDKLLDAARLREVGASFLHTFTHGTSSAHGWFLAAAAIPGASLWTRPRARDAWCRALAPAACVVLATCGYAAIFLMTPMDLGEHLGTTADRFLAQLHPALFFAFFTAIGALEDISPGRTPVATSPG